MVGFNIGAFATRIGFLGGMYYGIVVDSRIMGAFGKKRSKWPWGQLTMLFGIVVP